MPIRADLPPEPDFGAPLEPTPPSPETLRLLALRRSTPVATLTEPGPSAEDLDAMLRLAMRVPDHRKLEPWRVLIIEGEARNSTARVAQKQTGRGEEREKGAYLIAYSFSSLAFAASSACAIVGNAPRLLRAGTSGKRRP